MKQKSWSCCSKWLYEFYFKNRLYLPQLLNSTTQHLLAPLWFGLYKLRFPTLGYTRAPLHLTPTALSIHVIYIFKKKTLISYLFYVDLVFCKLREFYSVVFELYSLSFLSLLPDPEGNLPFCLVTVMKMGVNALFGLEGQASMRSWLWF